MIEAGSGTGQHVVDFARHMPGIVWWPSDLNEQHLKSIAAWRAHAGLPNIRPPLRIDLSDSAWCPELHDGSGPSNLLAVFCANVIHIAPWRVAEGLVAGAGPLSARATGGCSCTDRSSVTASTPPTAMPSSTRVCANATPNGACAISGRWRGWRPAGLVLAEIAEMPANNLILAFERAKPSEETASAARLITARCPSAGLLLVLVRRQCALRHGPRFDCEFR